MRRKIWIGLLCLMTVVGLSACGSDKKEILTNEVDLLSETKKESQSNRIEKEANKEVDEETSKEVDEETPEPITKTENESTTNTHEITASQKQDLLDFLTTLTWTLRWDEGKYDSTRDFAASFAQWSAGSDNKSRIQGKYTNFEEGEYSLYMTEEQVSQYLEDSIGYSDASGLRERFGYVEQDGTGFRIYAPDTGYHWLEKPQINEIIWISSEDILINSVITKGVENLSTTVNLDVVMRVNPDSVWGGFQFVEVRKWECYIFPNIDSEYITREDLSGLDEYYLRLARNEIYARHGYRFQDEQLQSYFGKHSWYRATKTDVPDSELNQYEIANRNLIMQMENEIN